MTCPYCEREFDQIVFVTTRRLIRDISLIVCSACHHLLIWGGEGPRKLTSEELLMARANPLYAKLGALVEKNHEGHN